MDRLVNKLSARISSIERQLTQLRNDQALPQKPVATPTSTAGEFDGNVSANLFGFQNSQYATSDMMVIPDEISVLMVWLPNPSTKGDAFGGITGSDFIIKTIGKNVLYEFVITANWEIDNDGFRTMSLEDPTGMIISSTFIPDKIPHDNNNCHRHQHTFKCHANMKGGWKVRLYHNSGRELSANIEMYVSGPIII